MTKCSKKLFLRIAVFLAAALLSAFVLFGGWELVATALTLERPSLNINWDAIPALQQKKIKLSYARNRLFGTVEFRSSMKNLPQWERVIRVYGGDKTFDEAFSKSGRLAEKATWRKLKASAKRCQLLDLLNEVNKFFNLWPYRSDLDVYGLIDYWATPAEFISRSGDCEDYAIIKFFALLQLGLSQDNMRVVVLKDTIRNVNHAVLAVYTDKEVYILDSISSMVLSHSKYGHYRPVLSVSLKYRWAHVPPSN